MSAIDIPGITETPCYAVSLIKPLLSSIATPYPLMAVMSSLCPRPLVKNGALGEKEGTKPGHVPSLSSVPVFISVV